MLDDNGNVYLLNRKSYLVLKFDRSGKLLKTIDLNITKSPLVYHHVDEIDILDNKYLLIRQYANILVYDLEGRRVKSIKLDFPVFAITALQDGKIGIKGSIIFKNGAMKWQISILDIHTEQMKNITYFMDEPGERKGQVVFEYKKGAIIGFSDSQRSPKTIMRRTRDRNLIVGFSANPDLMVYSREGQLISKIHLMHARDKVNPEELKKYQQAVEKKLEEMNAPDSIKQAIKLPDFYYQYMPYYYDVKIDSDNNILVFKYSEGKDHAFAVYSVYSENGKFLCDCRLNSGKYITPNLRLVTFHNNYVYGILQEKTTGVSLVKAQFK